MLFFSVASHYVVLMITKQLAALGSSVLLLFTGCRQTPAPSTPAAPDATELKVEDLQPGNGAPAVAGQRVTVHYTGWLTDGTKFDSSVGGRPFTFRLGAGEVIPGWDQGVAGMRIGGRRKLIIPPQLGYGTAGAPGAIPPNATLLFEVELLDAK